MANNYSTFCLFLGTHVICNWARALITFREIEASARFRGNAMTVKVKLTTMTGRNYIQLD